MKDAICPKCKKRGLYQYGEFSFIGEACKYCHYHKTTHRRTVENKTVNGLYPHIFWKPVQ